MRCTYLSSWVVLYAVLKIIEAIYKDLHSFLLMLCTLKCRAFFGLHIPNLCCPKALELYLYFKDDLFFSPPHTPTMKMGGLYSHKPLITWSTQGLPGLLIQPLLYPNTPLKKIKHLKYILCEMTVWTLLKYPRYSMF